MAKITKVPKALSINSVSSELKSTPVKQASSASAETSAPVVTVLGHVDHGKTTLLDAIRKTNIASAEHGGITQKIGASQIEVKHEGKNRRITFIDTPGHEAFMQMRTRGGSVADIGLLVVSVLDGVMPQTQESIKILKASKIPYIVVLTKSDMAQKGDSEKVKGQLTKEEVMLEGKGGDVPVIEASAKTGQNVKELLDLILLVSDLHPTTSSGQAPSEFKGVVIESKLDPKVGPKATVVVKSGKLQVRDEISADGAKARVRSLVNDKGVQVKEAIVGDAVEILGFEKVPTVGSVVREKGADERSDGARLLDKGGQTKNEEEFSRTPIKAFREGSENLLRVVIVADSYGTLEAIVAKVEEKINIVSQRTGEVTPADVDFAKSVGAIILGFNAKISPAVEKLAREEKIIFRNYNLIYEMIDEIEDFLEGKRLSLEPKILGKAKVLASFPFDKKKIMGVAVLDGRVAKGDKIQVTRDDTLIGEGTIVSLRKGKEQTSKAEAGSEAGILLSNEFDFKVGDMVISQG